MSDITPSMSSVPGAGPKLGGNKGIIMAVIVVVILAAAAYLIFSSGAKPKTQPAEPVGQPGDTSTPATVPNEVYSYVGEITAVSDGQITMMAKKEMNLLEADASLTVMVNADTQVIRRLIPRVLPETGGADLFRQENITLSELSVGDQVTVVSATNVRGMTNFTAARIEVLVVQ